MQTINNISGLSEISDNYDGIIFDIWGVIHNGEHCFKAAIDCLHALQDINKPYMFLSNMPRRSHRISTALTDLGMPPRLCAKALTSGEAVHMALGKSFEYGTGFYFQGPERTLEIVPQGYQRASSLETADFILVSGIGNNDTPDDYAALIETGLKRGLPMICANPDLRVGHGSRLVSCAGLLAEAYENKGGRVIWMGKPHGAVYGMAADILGAKNPLMVGDSIRTDIAGANNAGIESLFVRSGIHKFDFRVDDIDMGQLCKTYGATPNASIAQLSW